MTPEMRGAPGACDTLCDARLRRRRLELIERFFLHPCPEQWLGAVQPLADGKKRAAPLLRWETDDAGRRRALIAAHLTGTKRILNYETKGGAHFDSGKPLAPRLLCYTLDSSNRTRWVCIDIDGGAHARGHADPDAVLWDHLERLEAAGVSAHIERSGGGAGWHLWIFFDAPVDGAKAKKWGESFLCTHPAKDGAALLPELFPKRGGARAGERSLTGVFLPWWHAAKPGGGLFYRRGEAGELQPYGPDDFATVRAARVEEWAREAAPAKQPRPNVGAYRSAPKSEKSAAARPEIDPFFCEALPRIAPGDVYGEYLGKAEGKGWTCRVWAAAKDDRLSGWVLNDPGSPKHLCFYSAHDGDSMHVWRALVALGKASNYREALRWISERSGVPIPPREIPEPVGRERETFGIDEARVRVRSELGAALDSPATTLDLVNADCGTGKSTAVAAEVRRLCETTRFLVAVPFHKIAEQQELPLRAASGGRFETGGKFARLIPRIKVLGADEKPVCHRPEALALMLAAGAPERKACEKCPYRSGCGADERVSRWEDTEALVKSDRRVILATHDGIRRVLAGELEFRADTGGQAALIAVCPLAVIIDERATLEEKASWAKPDERRAMFEAAGKIHGAGGRWRRIVQALMDVPGVASRPFADCLDADDLEALLGEGVPQWQTEEVERLLALADERAGGAGEAADPAVLRQGAALKALRHIHQAASDTGAVAIYDPHTSELTYRNPLWRMVGELARRNGAKIVSLDATGEPAELEAVTGLPVVRRADFALKDAGLVARVLVTTKNTDKKRAFLPGMVPNAKNLIGPTRAVALELAQWRTILRASGAPLRLRFYAHMRLAKSLDAARARRARPDWVSLELWEELAYWDTWHTGYYFNALGSNEAEGCTALVCFGTPRRNVDETRKTAAVLGLDPETHGIRETMRELIQVLGRARLGSATAPVLQLVIGSACPEDIAWRGARRVTLDEVYTAARTKPAAGSTVTGAAAKAAREAAGLTQAGLVGLAASTTGAVRFSERTLRTWENTPAGLPATALTALRRWLPALGGTSATPATSTYRKEGEDLNAPHVPVAGMAGASVVTTAASRRRLHDVLVLRRSPAAMERLLGALVAGGALGRGRADALMAPLRAEAAKGEAAAKERGRKRPDLRAVLARNARARADRLDAAIVADELTLGAGELSPGRYVEHWEACMTAKRREQIAGGVRGSFGAGPGEAFEREPRGKPPALDLLELLEEAGTVEDVDALAVAYGAEVAG